MISKLVVRTKWTQTYSWNAGKILVVQTYPCLFCTTPICPFRMDPDPLLECWEKSVFGLSFCLLNEFLS